MWLLGEPATPKKKVSRQSLPLQIQAGEPGYSHLVNSITSLSLNSHAWQSPSRNALTSRRFSMENASMLPQPTARSGGVLRALSEVSDADNNVRSGMLPPSSLVGLKRQASNLPEPTPAPKRKTLAERAGEIRPPTYGSINSTNVSSASAPSTYRGSSNSSYLSRSTSNSSRATSNNSFTGSLSSGIRPPGTGSVSSIGRPTSSLGRAHSAKAAVSRPPPPASTASSETLVNKRKDPSHISFSQDRIGIPPRNRMLHMTPSLPHIAKRTQVPLHPVVVARRDMSVSEHFKDLSLDGLAGHRASSPPLTLISCFPTTPSKLPKRTTPIPTPSPSPRRTCVSPTKRVKNVRSFLTTDTTIENFDLDEQYHDFKRMFADYQHMYKDSMEKVEEARNETNVFKEAITKIEQERSSQTENMVSLRSENEMLKYRVQSLEESLAALRKEQLRQLDDLRQRQKEELETARNEQRGELERIKLDHREEIRQMKQRHQDELDHERAQKIETLSQVSTQGALDKQRHQMDIEKKEQEVSLVKQEVERINTALEREKELNDDLRKNLSSAGDTAASMENARQGLQAKIAYLESDSKSQSEAYAAMEKRMNEALQKAGECEEKLRKEETLRRKLHNQVQELKGNIRVFCRVRPTLDMDEDLAKMKYPDLEESTEIEVRGQDEVSSLGKDITKTYPFAFDRVFSPDCTNEHIFTEISQLIQSALDGYNVCIFAYGQTGSGKTYTMSADDGMIPSALRQIYTTSKDLESRGWTYSMEGSFVEVYNEELRDLLGDDNSTKKHEIRHDMTKMETTITDVTALTLDSQEQVEQILSQAMARRSVAATKANERSSRSHSVFILKLRGENSITGERSKGTLNLVDLAGSERIRNSDTAGNAARLKETQNINKSLSCLGDVIGALGQGVGTSPTFDARASVNNASAASSHIPYRNSKLTYLLQFSLGGNSKTLMFVMVAPEKKCLGETITSLKFAEKVAKTKVGVAKKVR